MTRLEYVYADHVPKEKEYLFKSNRHYRVVKQATDCYLYVECELPGVICFVIVENDVGLNCAFLNRKWHGRWRMNLEYKCFCACYARG